MRRVCLLGALVGCAHNAALSAAERADAAHREGQSVIAYEAYGEALCAEPTRLDLVRRLVETWNDLGRAGTPLARLESCDLPIGTLAFVEGLAAGARGDVDVADSALARAETTVAEPAEVAYRRGVLALQADRPGRALEHLERAAGLAAGRVDVRLARARALVELGRGAEAIAALGDILQLAPSDAELDLAGRVHTKAVRSGEPALAEAVERVLLDVLTELEKGTPRPETLARVQALADEDSHPRVLKVAGLVALHRGLQDEARSRLMAAAAANPLDPEPWRILGAARFAEERAHEALVPLREAWQRDPFDASVARMLARTTMATGDPRQARDAYHALTVLEPRVADYYLGLARSERSLGHVEVARRAAERGCRLQADHIPLLVELAALEAQLARSAPTEQERERARQRTHDVVNRLLEVAPDHPGAATILDSLEPNT